MFKAIYLLIQALYTLRNKICNGQEHLEQSQSNRNSSVNFVTRRFSRSSNLFLGPYQITSAIFCKFISPMLAGLGRVDTIPLWQCSSHHRNLKLYPESRVLVKETGLVIDTRIPCQVPVTDVMPLCRIYNYVMPAVRLYFQRIIEVQRHLQ